MKMSVNWCLLRPHSVTVIFLRMGLVLVLLASSGCAWLDGQQRQVIYRPTAGVPADFGGLKAGDEHYFSNAAPTTALTRADGQQPPDTPQRVDMMWLPHANPDAPTLLYLHGTFRNLFENLHKINALRAAGFAVLGVEYRGWGLSTPITPSEQSILQDAEVAWKELVRRQPKPGLRVIYGHSMGSGVAVDLASRLQANKDYGALILESSFTSFRDIAWEAGILTGLLAHFNQERFDSIDKIARVNAPVLMLHGSNDSTIPMRLGEQLFAAANPPKQWFMLEGASHSDLDQVNPALYQTVLQGFAATYLSAP